jgi:hypothetical protein
MLSDLQFRAIAGGAVSPAGSVLPGGVTGTRGIHLAGVVDGAGATFETVWPPGGTYVFPTSANAAPVQVAAGDAADDVGGTGAITVYVEGLDASGDEVVEVIETNGIAAGTPSNASFWRLNRVFVSSVGPAGYNVGDINIVSTGAGTPTLAVIQAEYGAAEQLIYTVPAGYTGFITQAYVTTDSNEADVELFARSHAAPSDLSQSALVTARSVGVIRRLNRVFEFPMPLPQYTDVWARARRTTASDAWVTVDADMMLVETP